MATTRHPGFGPSIFATTCRRYPQANRHRAPEETSRQREVEVIYAFDDLMSEMSFWIRFVLAVLTTWRVTHLLASEDSPADLIARIRVRLGQSLAGKLLDCFNCRYPP